MKTLLLCLLLLLLIFEPAFISAQQNKKSITVPAPLTVGIDDLGWKQGWSTDVAKDKNKPHHLDCPEGRWMVLADYKSVVDIAKQVNSRLLCLFIMSEFDRSNICAEYPTTTEEGENWDNSALVSDEDFQIMDYVKNNSAYMEFGLHGIRHEYWDDGHKKTGEWANLCYNRNPYPLEDMQNHLHCYKRLLDQYNISFPKTFVPPKHCYYHNPEDLMDTGGLMASWGVKYVSWGHKYWRSDYDQKAVNPLSNCIFNHGVLVLERDQSVPWKGSVGMAPDTISTDFYYECTHWHNYVANEPQNNDAVGEKWVKWFNIIKDSPNRYLPKNTVQLYSQSLYLKYADIKIEGSKLFIDNRKMPNWAYENDFVGNLVVKVPLANDEHISAVRFGKGQSVASVYEERGFGYLVLPKLNQKRYEVEVHTGGEQISDCVVNKGTYNVGRLQMNGGTLDLSITMYGTQNVHVKMRNKEPKAVKSLSSDLLVNSWKWHARDGICEINITAKNMQGVQGDISIELE